MNQQNLASLKEQLCALEFPDKFDLMKFFKDVTDGNPEEIRFYAELDSSLEWELMATLSFTLNCSDEYTFDRYVLLLVFKNSSEEERGQIFFVNNGVGITFVEGFNLLQGRAVYKTLQSPEGKKYEAWIQLDFEAERDSFNNFRVLQYRGQIDFDLEKILEEYPIDELKDHALKEAMIQSLKKGCQYPATFARPNNRKILIEANPRSKDVKITPF